MGHPCPLAGRTSRIYYQGRKRHTGTEEGRHGPLSAILGGANSGAIFASCHSSRLLEVGGLRRGILDALPTGAGILSPALIHDADKHNGDGRAYGGKYHRPASQGAGVLILDAQDGQDEAPDQPQKQQKHKENAQAVCEAQKLQEGKDPALFSGQPLAAVHQTRPWVLAKR